MTMTTPPAPDNHTMSDGQTKHVAKEPHNANGKGGGVILLLYLVVTLILSIYITAYAWFYHAQRFVNWGGKYGLLLGWLFVTVALALTAIVAFSRSLRLAVKFFDSLYGREEENSAAHIERRLYGTQKIVIIKDGKVDPKSDWITWLGGPARLLIFDGNVLYLERGNIFSRVVGPTTRLPMLDAAETVRAVIDLHPQVVVKPGVRGWTKDGIQVQMDVRLECQIGLEGMTEATSKGLLYAYGPISVKKAVESIVVRYDGQKKCLAEFDWVGRVGGYVEGELSTYIFSHTLDELFLASQGPEQLLSPQVTANWLRDINRQLTTTIGMRVLSLQITNARPVDDAVNLQRVKSWEARKQSAMAVSEGQTKAYAILAHEKARTEAERDLIDAIVNGLRRALSPDPSSPPDPSRYSEQIILSLSGILDQSFKDSDYGMYIPGETLESFNKLRELLDLPNLNGGQDGQKNRGDSGVH